MLYEVITTCIIVPIKLLHLIEYKGSIVGPKRYMLLVLGIGSQGAADFAQGCPSIRIHGGSSFIGKIDADNNVAVACKFLRLEHILIAIPVHPVGKKQNRITAFRIRKLVITSYSIHYTKLYDEPSDASPFEIDDGGITHRLAVVGQDGGQRNANPQNFAIINLALFHKILHQLAHPFKVGFGIDKGEMVSEILDDFTTQVDDDNADMIAGNIQTDSYNFV